VSGNPFSYFRRNRDPCDIALTFRVLPREPDPPFLQRSAFPPHPANGWRDPPVPDSPTRFHASIISSSPPCHQVKIVRHKSLTIKLSSPTVCSSGNPEAGGISPIAFGFVGLSAAGTEGQTCYRRVESVPPIWCGGEISACSHRPRSRDRWHLAEGRRRRLVKKRLLLLNRTDLTSPLPSRRGTDSSR